MQSTANLHQEVDAVTENKGRVGLQASEAGMSSSNAAGQCLQLRVWSKDNAFEISSETSDRKQEDKSKVLENKKLLKLLDERLRNLEEDDENLKGELMNSIKERSELISDIREHFEDLRVKGQERGGIQSPGFLAIEPPLQNNTRTDLSQVQCQESDPMSNCTTSSSHSVSY